jgi:hypothetical protein
MMLEAEVGGVLVRGIIDRLEEDADGQLVVTDYKTGRTPSVMQEQSRLGGVHFYAFLCQQVLGRIPTRIQLVYLGKEPQVITTTPSEQSVRGMQKKVGAIWAAVERACEHDDFRPKKSALCNWCAFQAYCPVRRRPRQLGPRPRAGSRTCRRPTRGRRPDRTRDRRRRRRPGDGRPGTVGTHHGVSRSSAGRPSVLEHPHVTRMDAAATRLAGAARGRGADRAVYLLSEAANHSMLWHGINLVDAVVGGPTHRRAALRRSVIIAVEQAVVNGPVKALVARDRPDPRDDHPHALRAPRTSSFPAGTLSAACAATLLSRTGGAPVWWTLAGTVAWTVHVGVHHAAMSPPAGPSAGTRRRAARLPAPRASEPSPGPVPQPHWLASLRCRPRPSTITTA